jgi:hypothetical protein
MQRPIAKSAQPIEDSETKPEDADDREAFIDALCAALDQLGPQDEPCLPIRFWDR